MRLEQFRYMGNSYCYNIDQQERYLYDGTDCCHVLLYECTDYFGLVYKAEWRIPGRKEKGLLYARRLTLKLLPWDVNRKEELKYAN